MILGMDYKFKSSTNITLFTMSRTINVQTSRIWLRTVLCL